MSCYDLRALADYNKLRWVYQIYRFTRCHRDSCPRWPDRT